MLISLLDIKRTCNNHITLLVMLSFLKCFLRPQSTQEKKRQFQDSQVSIARQKYPVLIFVYINIKSPSFLILDISRRPLWNLKMDQALLRIHNELLIDNLSIYWISDYCYEVIKILRGEESPIIKIPVK